MVLRDDTAKQQFPPEFSAPHELGIGKFVKSRRGRRMNIEVGRVGDGLKLPGERMKTVMKRMHYALVADGGGRACACIAESFA
jgi:hypothetical protein